MKLSDDFEQEIEFQLPADVTKVTVNCSGGADSSILFYMVCDYIQQNELDITVSMTTCSNDFKHRWNGRKAADVLNYTIDKLGIGFIDTHYTYYRDVQDVSYFHEFENRLFKDNRTDLIASGITSNPRIPASIEDANGRLVDLAQEALPIRNVENKDTLPVTDDGKQFYTPFVNVDKRFVAAMYTHYAVEDLFDLTRSCEGVPDQESGFDAEFEKNPCGKCWWCLERKWAFGRL